MDIVQGRHTNAASVQTGGWQRPVEHDEDNRTADDVAANGRANSHLVWHWVIWIFFEHM